MNHKKSYSFVSLFIFLKSIMITYLNHNTLPHSFILSLLHGMGWDGIFLPLARIFFTLPLYLTLFFFLSTFELSWASFSSWWVELNVLSCLVPINELLDIHCAGRQKLNELHKKKKLKKNCKIYLCKIRGNIKNWIYIWK